MLQMRTITEEFRYWLNDQTGQYDYDHCRDCAFARFLKEKHGPNAHIEVGMYSYAVDGFEQALPSVLAVQLQTGKSFERLRHLIDTGQAL